MQTSWMNLPVQVLHFELEMLNPFRLPAFAGSLFRGALGWALKEVCSQQDYQYLFETSSETRGQSDAFRPFVLIPPIRSRELGHGDRFVLTLKLLGRGCEHLASFVEAVRVAGQFGLGSQRAVFDIVRILAREGQKDWVAYERSLGWDRAYFPLPTALGAFALPLESPITEIEVEFCTPTRLVHQGSPVECPDFHVVLRSLYRRLDGLLQHHGSDSLGVDFRQDIAEASLILGEHEVNWVDWERTSSRQGRRHQMGGLVGRSRYRGPLERHWIELLSAGQIAHLGKATTFGMGAYRLQIAI